MDNKIIEGKILSNLKEPSRSKGGQNTGEIGKRPPHPSGSGRNKSKKIRIFESGATRNLDDEKLDFEGFLSPLVIKRYAEYMHSNRKQADDTIRDSDNWQKGIDLKSYIKSGWRHFFSWWYGYRRNKINEDDICALIFNASGYLHETLKERNYE